MKRFGATALSLTTLLAACGTPQEQCISSATRDMRVVDRLIAEAETNISLGFAYETREVTHTEWVICDYVAQPPTAPGVKPPPPKPRYCLDDVTDTVQKPVAIDPVAEKHKLAALKAKRVELTRRAAPAIAACQAKFPE